MNIFYLDRDITKCAQYHNNKHVVKMILESAQLLCTAHHELGSGDDTLYRKTHVNHPSAKWVRESDANYLWLWGLFRELLAEYNYRYGKVHASARLLERLYQLPCDLPDGNFTDPPQAMPDEYKNEDAVEAYREYYRNDKAAIAQYKQRPVPSFMVGIGWNN